MKSLLVILSLFIGSLVLAQNIINGQFVAMPNVTFKLVGFSDFEKYEISQVQSDNNGNFSLSYSKDNYGVGYLTTNDDIRFDLILSGEAITIRGVDLSYPESIVIAKGLENQLYDQYAREHPKRENTLAGWDYLIRIYQADSLFSVQKEPLNAIIKERNRIFKEDQGFLDNLPADSYVRWYLSVRKLVSSVSTVAQYRTEFIPSTLAGFRALDYSDWRFYKSGAIQDILESQFWLIENGGYASFDEMYAEMGKSIDAIVDDLIGYDEKLNMITTYLFNMLEKRSLFGAAEHLSLKLLNEQGCTLDDAFAKQLESYRTMKVGNKAPNIKFEGDVFKPNNSKKIKSLYDIKDNFTLVVFGASWCPMCAEEIPQIVRHYTSWKEAGVEVIFVSLDTEKQLFESFASKFPFYSICDYKKWESKPVEDYMIFATPTMYLLDKDKKIVLKPNSVYQTNSWIEWKIKGNID